MFDLLYKCYAFRNICSLKRDVKRTFLLGNKCAVKAYTFTPCDRANVRSVKAYTLTPRVGCRDGPAGRDPPVPACGTFY